MEGMKIKNLIYRSLFKTDTGRPAPGRPLVLAPPAKPPSLSFRTARFSAFRAAGNGCLARCLFLSAAMTLGGCVMTPHTTIQGTLNGSPFLVKAPKDGDLTGFDLVADTNGVVRVHIDHLAVKMNPDVISQTGLAQTAIIKATGDALSNAAAAAAAGAVQGLKAAQ